MHLLCCIRNKYQDRRVDENQSLSAFQTDLLKHVHISFYSDKWLPIKGTGAPLYALQGEKH